MKKDDLRHGGARITIYTDGAARGNPGPAGWGAVIMIPHNDKLKVKSEKLKVVEIGGRVAHATNNQMELIACIKALEYVKKDNSASSARQGLAEGLAETKVEIFCDSQYVVLGITEWIQNWVKKNWRNAAKKPVLNKELWMELFKLTREFKIKWTYVEGHTGIKHNERADEIATSFADNNPVI